MAGDPHPWRRPPRREPRDPLRVLPRVGARTPRAGNRGGVARMSEHYYQVSDYGPPTEDKCPTEQAPAPEPAPRWTEDRGFIKPTRGPIIESEIKAALDALNALDRDGVVWGDPRPPETAPDEMVLAHEVSGWGVCYGKTVRDSPTQFSGWYLLPKVGTDA